MKNDIVVVQKGANGLKGQQLYIPSESNKNKPMNDIITNSEGK